MAYDSARQRVVLFGGYNGSANGETWEWDGFAWDQVAGSSSQQPGARFNARMAYDAARGECVMFGKETNLTPQEQTWLWNGSQWRADSDTPGGNRSGYAIAYDPIRQRVVAHGGRGFVTSTYEWDGSVWPIGSNSVPPAGRSGHVAAFFPLRGKVVMFGGYASPGVPTNELWEWNGSAWSAVPQVNPPPTRYSHAMAYDAARSRLVVVGGTGDVIPCGATDTWEFDGATWRQMNSGSGFSGVAGGSAVYDEARQQVVLFGGQPTGCATFSGQTRVWTAKPAVSGRLRPISTCPGGTASFSIAAVGNNAFLNIQWRRDGIPITDVPNHISGAGTSSLSIVNCVAGDTGQYDCLLTNQCGSVTSNPAMLTVTIGCNLADIVSIGGGTLPNGNACPDGLLTGDDFNAFISAFAAGDPLADVTGIGGPPATPDGLITGDDFNAFIAAFANGCP